MERESWCDADVARAYAEGFSDATRQCVEPMVRAVGAAPGVRVLDLCCGPGIVSAELVAHGAHVTGLDFSEPMLERARRVVDRATFVHGDANTLPFEDGAFDAVTIGFGLPHLPEPERALMEVRRVMRTGGRLAFTCWQGAATSTAFAIAMNAVETRGVAGVALPSGPDFWTLADRDAAFGALTRTGFTPMDFATIHSRWIVADPDRVYDYFAEGTARMRALLQAQPPRRRAAIRSAMREAVMSLPRNGKGWVVPIPAALTVAVA